LPETAKPHERGQSGTARCRRQRGAATYDLLPAVARLHSARRQTAMRHFESDGEAARPLAVDGETVARYFDLAQTTARWHVLLPLMARCCDLLPARPCSQENRFHDLGADDGEMARPVAVDDEALRPLAVDGEVVRARGQMLQPRERRRGSTT
jgi:hypothetical protein